MILDVVMLPDERLKQKSIPVTKVTDEIRLLIENMFETMYAFDGVGLAGVQVGKLIRLFVVDDREGHKIAFINPQIIATSAETGEYDEGCLSIPGESEEITRPIKVSVQALNERGKPFTINAEGLLARVIQHEYDHLDGFLYIDRGDKAIKEKIVEKFIKKSERKAKKEAEKASKKAKLDAKLAAKAKK